MSTIPKPLGFDFEIKPPRRWDTLYNIRFDSRNYLYGSLRKPRDVDEQLLLAAESRARHSTRSDDQSDLKHTHAHTRYVQTRALNYP